MTKTDLSVYNNGWFRPGGGVVKRLMWYFCNVLLLKNGWFPFNVLKVAVLRAFGAKVGRGVVIKPCVNIKYPWNLEIGDYSWIGENVWIDNLTQVKIGNNVCISQGAMLLCGNHNYKKTTFDLMVGEISIEEGAWIGAQCVVCPGVRMASHSVLTVGSVASKECLPYSIYRGNPAVKVMDRVMESNL